jgi:hypothetical protein
MYRKIYIPMFVASLAFVACNNSQPIVETKEIKKAPAAVAKSVKEATVTKVAQAKATSKERIITTIDGVKYEKKPLIQEQGMLHIDSFAKTLETTVKSAMKDGVTTAFGVCGSLAISMTDEYNALTTDTKIRRTALKYRNPKNKPDAIDKSVMNELIRKGDFKPVTVDVGAKYRVYKPLPTKAECIVCHGNSEEIPKKVSDMIKRKYPKDLAVDFAKGEFRGVIVAEIIK